MKRGEEEDGERTLRAAGGVVGLAALGVTMNVNDDDTAAGAGESYALRWRRHLYKPPGLQFGIGFNFVILFIFILYVN